MLSKYNTSIPEEKKVRKASLGLSTIGSPEILKLVFINTGDVFSLLL